MNKAKSLDSSLKLREPKVPQEKTKTSQKKAKE